MELRLLRHATLKLNVAGRTMLIDPFFAPKHSRPSYTGRSPNPLVELPERGTVIAAPACNDGGTRERVPPASDSRATSRLVGIKFAFVIWSQCCTCRFTA
jgi:hypothetical protein